MKHIHSIRNHVIRGTLGLAVAGLAVLASHALAQEKGAERLMKLQRLEKPADVRKVPANDTIGMPCPKCKDTWVTVVENTGKGANPRETKHILRHECPGCSAKIVTQGVGKQAQNKIVHVCNQCGNHDASCCGVKRGVGPAPGREGHQH